MKTETLRALLVDRELGELPPEVKELLDAYIEVVPATRSEVEATTRTLSTARETVRRYPNLEVTTETKVIPIWMWLARAAAVIVVAAAGWFALRPGKTAPPVVQRPVKKVWAQYQVAYDSSRGRYVVAQQDGL